MTTWEMIVVLLAGIGAGAINTVVGTGTLITFPTLVGFGLPPVTATISNAIGLVAGSVSGTWGYRRELAGQGRQLRWQIPASFCGAIVGCWLLLHLPETVFNAVVPVLLIGALILVAMQPRLQRWAAARRGGEAARRPPLSPPRIAAMVIATFLIGIYGGYFTAAQGIMLVAALGVIVPDELQRTNAVKNLLALVVNVVAATTYTLVAFDRIDWTAVGLIAAGSQFGGVLGARYGRRLSPTMLRATIIVVGLIGLWRLLF